MDEFLKKLDLVSMVDTSKLNTFLLKEKALEFTKIKSENPKFSQVEICKMLGTSDSTMRRIRNDLGIASPFRHTVKSKKSRKTRVPNERVTVERIPLEKVPDERVTVDRVPNDKALYDKALNKSSLKKNTKRKDVLASENLPSGTLTELEEEISKKQLNEILGN